MNNFLNKLERKFGRYAIPDLIRYVIVLYCAGAVIGMINPRIYYNYLCLDMSAVFRGQIWRLFTFLIEPYGFSSGMGMLLSILFFVIQVQLFFLFGRSLEQAWGTFRFNMYFLSGYLFNIQYNSCTYIVYITAAQCDLLFGISVYLLVDVFCFCGIKSGYAVFAVLCHTDKGKVACTS